MDRRPGIAGSGSRGPCSGGRGPACEAQVCPGLTVPVNRSTAAGQGPQQFGIRVALAVAAEPLALPEAALLSPAAQVQERLPLYSLLRNLTPSQARAAADCLSQGRQDATAVTRTNPQLELHTSPGESASECE